MMGYEMVSETRDIKDITRLVLRDYGQLFLNQGETESLRIEAPSDLLSLVRTEIKGNELILDIQGGWFDKTWRAITSTIEGKPLKYYVTVKTLEGIYVTGAGRVKMQALKSEHLSVILKGAGEVMLSQIDVARLDADLPGAGVISIAGKATFQQVRLLGAGSYDAPRLESVEAEVLLKGVGKATIWVKEKLEARVDGVGSIEYYGDPVARKSVSGLGQIQQRFN